MSVADIRFCLIEDSDDTNSRNKLHTLFFLEVMQDWPKTELKFILPLHVEEIFFFVLGGIVGLTTKFCFVGLSAVFP